MTAMAPVWLTPEAASDSFVSEKRQEHVEHAAVPRPG
jgi:hypothetical protein